ncbi:MAG: NAD(P)-dependent oxidoreductase [Desulfobacteraceae bacterium]|nr:MAG: NAD(P)-dependent oxidoreductase [Desulfobacteraceae bacterium]
MNPVSIGWIGTGVMGQAMCGHMIDAGHRVYVFNRTPRKADALIEKGAQWCDTPRATAQHSDILFCMVGYPQDVEEVLFGPQGILTGDVQGKIVVDMTTSRPDLAAVIYRKAQALGAAALDAPVSGGDIGARNATLAIMVGGDKKIFDRVLPLFQLLGKNIAYMGDAGAGQHTKMCNQVLIAGTMIGVVESLLYARRTGLDPDAIIDVIGQGAASSWAINNLGRRIARNDFNPGFYIRHFVKDMGIALDEARRMHLSLPGLALVHQFYVAAMAQGDQELGTQALYKILARMNGETII